MNNKVLLALLALIFSINSMAADDDSGAGVSVTTFLGMNVAGVHDHPLYENARIGGTLGVKLDYFLPKAGGAYLSTGIDWTQKGAKEPVYVSTDESIGATAKLSLHYLEIPVRMGFLFDFTEAFALYAETGPYVAVGIGGKNRLGIDSGGKQWDEQEGEFSLPAFKQKSKEDATFRRLDAGLGFRVGAEFYRHYNVLLGCDWGLIDMWRTDHRDYVSATGGNLKKCRNFNFTIAVGYRF